MKLTKIELYNFRQYLGSQTIQFACNKDRNVTVIHGLNGAGKTSLFTALNWCLYDEGAENIGSLINKRVLVEAGERDQVEAFVLLEFTHEEEKYVVKRSVRANKGSGETPYDNLRNEFIMKHQRTGGKLTPVSNPTGVIESILPSAVRTYFFFDGEKIDNFAKPNTEKEIEEAVRNVLKIEVLQRAGRHLNQAAKKFDSELRAISTGSELQRLLDEAEKKRYDIEIINKDVDESKEQSAIALGQLTEVNTKLESIAEIQNWARKRRENSEKLNEFEERRQKVVDRTKVLAQRGHVYIAKYALAKAVELIEAKHHASDLSSSIRAEILQELIDKGFCICGRPISEHGQERHTLQELLGNAASTTTQDATFQTKASLNVLNSYSTSFPEQFKSTIGEKSVIDDAINVLRLEEDEISRHLQDYDQGEVSDLERCRTNLEQDIDNFTKDIIKAQGQMELLSDELKNVEKGISRIDGLEEKAAKIRSKWQLARETAGIINQLYDGFADDMRKRIEKEARTIFKQLVWKESHFKDVLFSEDYKLEVIDAFGYPARPELSAGERQVLSLAFISGMAKVSEEEAPLIMDTPFGRLSTAHRANITARLPTIAEQLVLLVTDEELRDEALDNLRPFIGQEYTLDFDQATSCTFINKVAV